MPVDVIRVRCDACGATFKVAAHHAGKAGGCPKCGAEFVVPQPAAQPVAAASGRSESPDGGVDDLATAALAHAAAAVVQQPGPAGPPPIPSFRHPAAQPSRKANGRAVYIAVAVSLPVLLLLALGVKSMLNRPAESVPGTGASPAPGPAPKAAPVGSGGTTAQPQQSPILPPEQAAALDKQIVEQLNAANREADAQAMTHRKAMETLSDQLRRACLKEPDLKAFSYAKDVQQQVLWQAQDGNVVDPEILAGAKRLFARTETQSVIDGMAAEARRRRAEIVQHQQRVAALEGQRPYRQLLARWKQVAADAQARLSEADALLRGGDGGGAAGIEARGDVENLIGRIESDDRTRLARTGDLQQRLRAVQQRAKEVRTAASDNPPLLTETAATDAAIARAVDRLEASKGQDRAAMLAYHRRFLAGLPSSLTSLASLNAVGTAVALAKTQAPAQWTLPILADAYARWQGAAFERLRQSDFGQRLREAVAAREAGLAGFADDGRWHRAATAIPANELEQLVVFLTKAVLDPKLIRDRDPLIQVADDARTEQASPAAGKGAGLVPVSAVLQGRKTALADPAARAHHQAVFQRWNERGTLADVGAMKKFIAEDAKAYPAYWNDTVRQVYADYQAGQWWAFTETRFDAALFKAVEAYQFRRDDLKGAAAGVNISVEELRGVRSILDGGVISPERFRKANRSEMGKPGPYERLAARVGNLTAFFDELAGAKELAEGKGPPPLAAANPAAPAANADVGADARDYHAALIRRFNAGKTLADVVAIKKVVDAESKAHPEQWKDDAVLKPYADLQADQWLGFYESSLKKDADALTTAYLRKSVDPAGWNKAARRWKAYARDMLALLKGGRVNETEFWTRVATSGRAVGPATGTLVDPAFWEAVLKIP